MVYLLDANVLIDAHRDYYGIERVPEFWDWLQHRGSQGDIQIPVETFEEVIEGRPDELTAWIRQDYVKESLLLDEEADPELVQRVISDGYADDLTDEEIVKLGRDPFLISYALAEPAHRIVVTTEGRKPRKRRANRRVPDVCDTLTLEWRHTFQLTRELNFSTSWRGA